MPSKHEANCKPNLTALYPSPFAPTGQPPMTDDEVLARAVEVRRYDDGEIIAVMFDKTKEDNK